MSSNGLHTIERSHGDDRLTGPRLSDLGTVPTGEEPARDKDAKGRYVHGNQAAVGRTAKEAIRRPYREAEKRLGEALEARVEPSVADRLLADAMAIYRSARRELASGSAFVHGSVIAFSIETTLAGYFMSEAAAAGLLTDRGMQLHDRVLACEQAAARAMTAALAAVKALSGRRPKKNRALATIDAAGEEA